VHDCKKKSDGRFWNNLRSENQHFLKIKCKIISKPLTFIYGRCMLSYSKYIYHWEEGGVVGWEEGEGREGVGWDAKGVIWSFYEELKKLGCKSLKMGDNNNSLCF